MKHQRVTRNRQRSRKIRLYTLLSIFAFSLLIGGSSIYISKNFDISPLAFYSNLANPNMRYVTIPAGMRKEQIAQKFGEALSWDQKEIEKFIKTGPVDEERGLLDGYFMPGSYWVNLTDKGDDVAIMMMKNFNKVIGEKVLAVQGTQKKNAAGNKINLDTAVRIASLLQKEAAGGKDARIISGIIWNRLFSGMTLDIDATLQYAKGTEENWWPKPRSEDKYIDSPFNTYRNKGLPPTAIANPSWSMIEAALNPQQTDCVFYIHDNNRGFHCTKTYEAHKQNVQRYLVGKR
ncbi:MAG TPA: endolytic transglycosylase MltG [Candidatus Paceibacterota bacterium]